MTTCNKCGLPLIFTKRGDKWYPLNPDKTEHWDSCKATINARTPAKSKPARVTEGTSTHFYPALKEPPWDERLGRFRDFSPEEKILIDAWNAKRWMKTV